MDIGRRPIPQGLSIQQCAGNQVPSVNCLVHMPRVLVRDANVSQKGHQPPLVRLHVFMGLAAGPLGACLLQPGSADQEPLQEWQCVRAELVLNPGLAPAMLKYLLAGAR